MPYRRVQVLLKPEQDDHLALQARELARSQSDLIRQAVEGVWPAEPECAVDLFLAAGPFDPGPDAPADVARNHDFYTYDLEHERWQR